MGYTLEICANSAQSALNAQAAGANRVELCASLWESGTTPSYGTIKKVRELLNIELYVLVRPRGGDFVYASLELDILKEDISMCKKLGVDGIVSGALQPDNTIDLAATESLIAHSYPLKFTFHRAFDLTPSLPQALDELIALKANRVLTSGGLPKAAQGAQMIAQLQRQAEGKITVVAGGGIRAENIGALLATGCTEFHMTGNDIQNSPALPPRIRLNGADGIPESDYRQSSISNIEAVSQRLDKYFG